MRGRGGAGEGPGQRLREGWGEVTRVGMGRNGDGNGSPMSFYVGEMKRWDSLRRRGPSKGGAHATPRRCLRKGFRRRRRRHRHCRRLTPTQVKWRPGLPILFLLPCDSTFLLSSFSCLQPLLFLISYSFFFFSSYFSFFLSSFPLAVFKSLLVPFV